MLPSNKNGTQTKPTNEAMATDMGTTTVGARQSSTLLPVHVAAAAAGIRHGSQMNL